MSNAILNKNAWKTKSRLRFQFFHFFPKISKTFPSPPLPRCSLTPLIFGCCHWTPPMPPLVKSTIQNRSHHQLVIWLTFTRHNDRRCPPSKNWQVTSWKIRLNTTTGNFSLLLSGFSNPGYLADYAVYLADIRKQQRLSCCRFCFYLFLVWHIS